MDFLSRRAVAHRDRVSLPLQIDMKKLLYSFVNLYLIYVHQRILSRVGMCIVHVPCKIGKGAFRGLRNNSGFKCTQRNPSGCLQKRGIEQITANCGKTGVDEIN